MKTTLIALFSFLLGITFAGYWLDDSTSDRAHYFAWDREIVRVVDHHSVTEKCLYFWVKEGTGGRGHKLFCL